MVYFCKSGLMIIKGSDGTYHYFNPQNSLKEVSSYIWSNDSLSEFHIEFEPGEADAHNIFYIDPPKEAVHRLRSRSSASIMDDKYYTDTEY